MDRPDATWPVARMWRTRGWRGLILMLVLGGLILGATARPAIGAESFRGAPSERVSQFTTGSRGSAPFGRGWETGRVSQFTETPIRVLDASARVEFPSAAMFEVEAETVGGAAITEVTLLYSLPEQRYGGYQRVVRPDFQPGPRIRARWRWSAPAMTIPPGTTIMYRWRMVDADGSIHETPNATLIFTDPRIEWQEARADKVAVRWFRGDARFGRDLLSLASSALDRLSAAQGLDLKTPITIVVYPSQREMTAALPGLPAWAGGVSLGTFDTVVVAVRPDPRTDAERSEGERVVVHELAHQIVYQSTFNTNIGSRLPTWLDEGLAVVAEGESSAEFRRALREAVAADTLPTLRQLGTSFGRAGSADATLRYASAESAVRYLLHVYGQDKMRALLAAFREGRTPDDAVQIAYGRTVDGIEDGWRRDLGLRPRDRGQADTGDDAPAALSTVNHGVSPAVIWAVLGGVLAILIATATVSVLMVRRRLR